MRRSQVLHLINWSSVTTSLRAEVFFFSVWWPGAFRFVLKEMPKKQKSLMIQENQLMLLINLGRATRSFSNNFWVLPSTVRKIFHFWKTFKTVSNLPRSGCLSKFMPRSDLAMFREITKCSKPRAKIPRQRCERLITVQKNNSFKLLLLKDSWWHLIMKPIWSFHNVQ